MSGEADAKQSEKCRFWLLDVNHEPRDGKPEIWMWGVDDHGRRVLVIDRNFAPYFYLVLGAQETPETVLERVRRKQAELPSVEGFELTVRRFFGQPVYAIKVLCRNPDLVPELAEALSGVVGVERCLEGDVRYSMRYLVDNDVSPCGWLETEVAEEDGSGIQVDRVLVAKSAPKRIQMETTPKLRVLSFHAVYHASRGTPKPDRDPVLVVATVTDRGERKQFVAEGADDTFVLASFVRYVRQYNPDVVVGFETNRLHWQYLAARAKRLGVDFSVDRVGMLPHTSVYGHVSVTGRTSVDVLDLADELPEVKVKTVENLADYLGVKELGKQTVIDETEYASYWDNPSKRSELVKFAKERAECISGVFNAMFNYAAELSRLVGLPLDHVVKAAVGFRTEWYMIREAFRIGELIPERTERPYIPYVGGIVLSPKPGIHENVANLDFKSMYPSIMVEKNVSPDTYLQPTEPEPPQGVNIAPEVGHRFRKEPPGFYRRILTSLLAARGNVRQKMMNLSPRSEEYRLLDARQRAIKVITNAVYGYAGWIGARWFRKPVAEAAAAWGRETISTSIELAKQMGLDVIYGDTDSIFVKYDPQKVEALCRTIEERLGLEMKPDKINKLILFTEAKKRYCGLLPDGSLDMVGLEAVRGDWANVAKDTQEKVLELVLKQRSPDKAVRFVREHIGRIRKQKVSFRDLIIWKTLTKPAEQYEVNAPHVQAAKMLMKEGWELAVGDKVGYVVTHGAGKLYERVKPYVFASYGEVDTEYYVSNQVVPAALRILSLFGVDEKALLEAETPKQSRTLADFVT